MLAGLHPRLDNGSVHSNFLVRNRLVDLGGPSLAGSGFGWSHSAVTVVPLGDRTGKNSWHDRERLHGSSAELLVSR